MSNEKGLFKHEKSSDLAGIEHWDHVYQSLKASDLQEIPWSPISYGSRAIAWALDQEFKRAQPTRLLEIGCGNSTWLGYLAKKYHIPVVAGIDYSSQGCQLARKNLEAEGVTGQILCCDFRDQEALSLGQFDFVYSLGVVEHFDPLEDVLMQLLQFVKPGGFLFTEVPNLFSIHGFLSWLWQPRLFRKHSVITKSRLKKIYTEVFHLESVQAYFAGIFGLHIVAWEIDPRWPRLAKRMMNSIKDFTFWLDKKLRRTGRFRGWAPFSPYVIACGRKPELAPNAEKL